MNPQQESLDAASAKRGVAALTLVRHGESEGNVADRAALEAKKSRLDLDLRDADVPLSGTGRQQAAAVRDYFASLPPDEQPSAVASSPYRRARETAEIAVEGLEVPLVVDERLRERDLGAFDGLTWIGIQQDYPQESQRRDRVGKFYYRPPGGESWADVALRVRQVQLELQERFVGERLCIFTHQATIMAFRVAIEGLEEAQVLEADKTSPLANCSLTTYVQGEHGLELLVYGDTAAVDRAGEQVTHERSRGSREPEA